MNDEDEAHLKSIVGSLIERMEISDEIEGKFKKMSSVQQKMIEDLNRRVEILELRLDIEEPKE